LDAASNNFVRWATKISAAMADELFVKIAPLLLESSGWRGLSRWRRKRIPPAEVRGFLGSEPPPPPRSLGIKATAAAAAAPPLAPSSSLRGCLL